MPQEVKNANKKPADIIAYRKARKRKSMMIKLLVMLGVMIIIFVVAINFSTIVEPLRGIASRIETRTSDEIGFPIQLPGSASYSFDDFGDGFLLLTDTYLYTFGTDGGQNYALKHGYTNPVQYANSKRILIYDKDYSEFALYSKTSEIYSLSTEEKIVFAKLSRNDMAAVITNSDRYSNIIYIYDGGGGWKYTRMFTEENIMDVAFSDDERYIYISTVGVSEGEIYSAVYKYDITSTGDAVWSYRLPHSCVALDMTVSDGIVKIIYDNYVLFLSERSGELAGGQAFSGTILSCEFAQGYTAVLYNSSSGGRAVLAVLNNDCTVTATTSLSVSINQIHADNGGIYTIENGKLISYNQDLEITDEKPLSDEYSSFIKIGGQVFLLGFDSVDMEDL